VRVSIHTEDWAAARPFRITGHVWNSFESVVVELSHDGAVGRGEALGVFYANETADSMAAEIAAVEDRLIAGIDRAALQRLLPPGGARNAVDCALWDLESKQAGRPVFELAGLSRPTPLLTTYTLGADTPEAMAAGATGKHRDAKAIKMKLLGDGHDAARVAAVRAARDDVWIGVDANQGFTSESLAEAMPAFIENRVELIEQPFKIGQEALLDGFVSPIPLAADESVQSLKDVEGLVGRFQVMNIKLDKCGGLTEGLLMAKRAKELGLKVMVGNMAGTSLAMAPAMLVGQYCDVVDLDGPMPLKFDREPATVYKDGLVSIPDGVWGWAG